jgi:polysaccharide export outer membrane protein
MTTWRSKGGNASCARGCGAALTGSILGLILLLMLSACSILQGSAAAGESRGAGSPASACKLPPATVSAAELTSHTPGLLKLAENIPAFGSPTPVATIPAPTGPTGYLIGVGDTLIITVYGQPDLTATVSVSDDGSVPLALIGKTHVAGLTPAQAAQHISDELKRGDYLVNPQVSITLSEYQSQQISVLGNVKNPGRFPVSVRLTVLDALALAGGITDLGSQRVYVLRPDKSSTGGVVTRYEIDVEALLANDAADQEYFDVRAGDTLIVPRAQVF